MDVLAGIFAAALLQDLSYTSKTALVSRGHRKLAVAADVSAMLTSSLYLILTASVTIRSGFSVATAEAFAAIALGGACGTVGRMFVTEWLERQLARKAPETRIRRYWSLSSRRPRSRRIRFMTAPSRSSKLSR